MSPSFRNSAPCSLNSTRNVSQGASMSALGSTGRGIPSWSRDSERHGTVVVFEWGSERWSLRLIASLASRFMRRHVDRTPNRRQEWSIKECCFTTRGDREYVILYACVPEKVAMKIRGHATRSVFDRYDITSGQDFVEAGRKLELFHSQKVGDKTGTALHQNAAAASTIN